MVVGKDDKDVSLQTIILLLLFAIKYIHQKTITNERIMARTELLAGHIQCHPFTLQQDQCYYSQTSWIITDNIQSITA